MENLKDLQLEHLMVPVVRSVPALIGLTMAAVAVDVPVATGEPALPAPVLATTVAVPLLAAPIDLTVMASPTAGQSPEGNPTKQESQRAQLQLYFLDCVS